MAICGLIDITDFSNAMRRTLAKTKSEKCKYKRCLGKRKFPVDKPIYCAKHVDKLNIESPDLHNLEFKGIPVILDDEYTVTGSTNPSYLFVPSQKMDALRDELYFKTHKKSLFMKIKDFIFVSK